MALFRQKATTHQQDVFLGEMLLTRPVSFSVLTIFFFAIAALILLYLVCGE